MFKKVTKFLENEKRCLESFIENPVGGSDATIKGIIGFIVLLVVLYIGVLILSGVTNSSTLTASDPLYDTQQALQNSTSSAYSMATVIPIVLAATLLLALLTGLMAKRE